MESNVVRLVLIAISMMFVLLSVSFVGAFGISSPSAINVQPGESVDATFSITNRGVGAEDIVVEVVVVEGSEYVEVTNGPVFTVPAGSVGTVNVKATVPITSRVGDSYPIKLQFNPVSAGGSGGGTVEIAFGYGKSFNVNVVSIDADGNVSVDAGASSTDENIFTWIVTIIIIVLIVWWILRVTGKRGGLKKKTPIEIKSRAKKRVVRKKKK